MTLGTLSLRCLFPLQAQIQHANIPAVIILPYFTSSAVLHYLFMLYAADQSMSCTNISVLFQYPWHAPSRPVYTAFPPAPPPVCLMVRYWTCLAHPSWYSLDDDEFLRIHDFIGLGAFAYLGGSNMMQSRSTGLLFLAVFPPPSTCSRSRAKYRVLHCGNWNGVYGSNKNESNWHCP